MFGKKANPADGRVHPRHSGTGMTLLIDGMECSLLDYSDGGVRISSRAPVRRVALIEIYKHGKLVRKTPAIVAWRRESEAGYAFRSNLRVCEVEGADSHRSQAQMRDERQTNDTGGVSGSALRARLRL